MKFITVCNNSPLRVFCIYKNDLLLIGTLLVLSCLPLLSEWQSFFQDPGQAEIWVNGKLQRTVTLTPDYHEEFYVQGIPGYAIIEIENGRIRLRDDNSPRQIGVHMSWISQPYEQIVNIPYKILIIIKGKEHRSVDAVSQ